MPSAAELAYRRSATYWRGFARRVLAQIPSLIRTAGFFAALWWGLIVLRALVAPAM